MQFTKNMRDFREKCKIFENSGNCIVDKRRKDRYNIKGNMHVLGTWYMEKDTVAEGKLWSVLFVVVIIQE